MILLFGCVPGLLGTPAAFATENPFRTPYVCVPPLNPTVTGLSFQVREKTPCGEGERWMQVHRTKDGVVMLLPIDPPLSKEENKDLETYKRFHGLD